MVDDAGGVVEAGGWELFLDDGFTAWLLLDTTVAVAAAVVGLVVLVVLEVDEEDSEFGGWFD